MPKKINKTKTAEFSKDREFGVILEGINSNIKLIMEGMDIFHKKIDAIMNMLARNTEGITMLNMRVTRIEDHFTKIEIDTVKIKDDMSVIKNDFGKRLTHLEVTIK